MLMTPTRCGPSGVQRRYLPAAVRGGPDPVHLQGLRKTCSTWWRRALPSSWWSLLSARPGHGGGPPSGRRCSLPSCSGLLVIPEQQVDDGSELSVALCLLAHPSETRSRSLGTVAARFAQGAWGMVCRVADVGVPPPGGRRGRVEAAIFHPATTLRRGSGRFGCLGQPFAAAAANQTTPRTAATWR